MDSFITAWRQIWRAMRRTSRALSPYRPRSSTLIVLAVVASLLVLANLSFDIRGAIAGTEKP